MEWNIRSNFDPGEETIHFGTRAFAESDGCIYEITTIATFQNENKVSDAPALNFGHISNGGLCVCVGNSLTVFEDEAASSVVFNMIFDGQIETFTCSPDGNFLLVGLSNGFIQVLHIPSEGEPVYTKKLQNTAKGGRTFVKILVDAMCPEDLLVVCSTGIVVNLCNFDFISLHSALTKEDGQKVKELLSLVLSSTICSCSSIAPIRSAALFKYNEQLVILAAGEGIAKLFTGLGPNGDSDVKWIENRCLFTFAKLQAASTKGPFVALNKSGELVSVCPYTLLTRLLSQKKDKLFYDFNFAGTSSESFIIGVSSFNEPTKNNLSLHTVSGLSEKFSLPIDCHSILMSTIGDVEDIFFLEFLNDMDAGTSTIALKAATQTAPKFRLERLLIRRKFEAAETLAKNFGLDMAPVHMARAKVYLDQMQPWSRSGCQTSENNQINLTRLLNELDTIADLDFVSNCCVSAVPPDYHIAHSLLKYAQKRLELFFTDNPELNESEVANWSGRICGLIMRLETLKLLKQSWDVEEWLQFSSPGTDLLREVHARIKQGELSEASVIWSRHKYSFRKSLEEETSVSCLVENIPPEVSLDKILEWLAHLLPSLLDVQPSALPKIVTYLLSKISGLEISHRRKWPQIGLDYTTRIVKLITSQNFASPFIGLEASPLRPLVVLRCGLADLCSLKTKYFIFITLQEYQQTPSEVALLLLDAVQVGSMPAFIADFLNGYMLDHRLDADDTIARYINLVLESLDGSWLWDEAPWESKIATLAPCITNYKIRLECVIATLEAAPVPWSPVISSLAEDGLKLKHPLAASIREKQRQIGTNLLLKKYGLRSHINKIDKKMFLKYIVKQDHPDMMADIGAIAQKSVEDYHTVIRQLFLEGKISKALEVLQNLPKEMIVQICPFLIYESSFSLDTPECDIENELEFISAVAVCHETAKALNPLGMSHIEDLNNPKDLLLPLEDLKNRFSLKREFGKYLTIKEMSSLSCRLGVLKGIITDLLLEVVENEKPQERFVRLYHQSLYASQLLKVPRNCALVELLQQSMNISDLELATDISGHIDDLECLPNRLFKKLVRLPALFFTKLQSVNRNGMSVKITQEASHKVCKVISKLCCKCSPDNFQDATNAFAWCRIWNFVSGQSEILLNGRKDSFMSWRFTPLYKDPGLSGFLNGSYVHDFLYAAFTFANGRADDNDQVFSKLTSFITRLQNDQHDLAVVLVLFQMFSTAKGCSRQFSREMLAAIEESLLKSCEVLINKVVAARQFDKYLGVGLLTCMGQSKAFGYLERMCKSFQTDFQRQRSLSCLGTIVCDLWKSPDLKNFKFMSVNSTWGLRLSEIGIPVKELLCGKADIDIVLQKLLGSKNVSPSLLEALCSDYQLDYQEVLLQHLCQVLLCWDPDPVVTVSADGSKDVIEQNTQQQLFDHSWDLQKNIRSKKILCSTLCNAWEKVNFYHHEVFLVILEILERHGVDGQTTKRLITTFLKNYRRIKAPDQAEEEFWAEVFPNSFGLPAMSEFRLPYNRRLTDTPFSVIKNELNLNTYKCWLSISSALDVPKDKICVEAINQTILAEFNSYQNNSEWCNSFKNRALLLSVAACVAEMDDLLQAAAMLYYFMNKIPPGLDQVHAANLCVQYADIVLAETGDAEYKAKVEKKYLHLATLQTLHQYGLGQPTYSQLAQNPTELIRALYQHPTILDLCRGLASHSLDINSAAEDICKLHSLCLKTMHVSLVTEWLQPDIIVGCNESFEDDCFPSMQLKSRRARESNQREFSDLYSADDSILRARYVMDSGDVQEWAYFLLNLVYNDVACTGMKLRAMQCLCMLTDDETLEELAGKPVSSIRTKLRTLAFLKNLEILGLTYSEAAFESCDKTELANLILRTQASSQCAASLLVHLCIEYKISHLSLWNLILQQLIDLSLMKELEQALSHTCEMFQLWTLPTFRKAWSLLLTSPFLKTTLDLEHESAMFHAVTLLPTCPILNDIDVTDVLEHCLSNQRPDIAVLLLPYVDTARISQLQEKILSMRKLENLLDDLRKINADRCINISKVVCLLSAETTD